MQTVSVNEDMINQLKEYEKNNLEDWYDLEDSEQKKFLRSLASYIEDHKTEVRNYCSNTEVHEFSSLSIIYEAASVYSLRCNDFILEEIKRVVKLLQKNKLKSRRLEILEDFELDGLFEKEHSSYCQVIGFLIDSLSYNQTDKQNIALLELIDFYLIESDEDEQYMKWVDRIEQFVNKASKKVKAYLATDKKKKRYSVIKSAGIVWQVLFLVGSISQLVAIFMFGMTLIDTKVPVGLYLIVGILGFFINKQLKIYVGNTFYRIVFSVVSFGGTFVALFLFLNAHFTSQEVLSNKYEIIEKSSVQGRKYHRSERRPIVYINVNGLKKGFEYPYLMTNEVDEAKYLIISTAKGLFGFDIIISEELE